MPERSQESQEPQQDKLSKELGLWDVYCIATGAMFSSGFFLLPGLATARAGPSAVVAYLIAGVLMVPSMLAMLELATALPRAGGAYYFLDRSLGPAVGTVTGLGTWLALILKSAFALVGVGAYLAIAPVVGRALAPGAAGTVWFIKALAVGLTAVFVVINILGPRPFSRLQTVFVISILAVLGLFVVQGLWHVLVRLPEGRLAEQFTPFLHEHNGWHGLASTVGLVFVSYAGLTQVASASEEVRRPERNLPLGAMLSLATATAIYVLGVFVMVAVLVPAELHEDRAPVATAAGEFFRWLPGVWGALLVTIAALAAFASTGNAGILAASRYPLAMARDRLIPAPLGKLGRFKTPSLSILLTGAATAGLILALSIEQVAKLGSTINLLVFGLINLAVIVMRESRIDSYDPAFRVPLYPWLPLAGLIISAWLIIEMGWLTILFSVGVIVAAGIWYVYYARAKVERYGAVHHVFARLGQYRHPGLREEFREIIKEKGLREDDPYDDIVDRAEFLEISGESSLDDVVRQAAEAFAPKVSMDASRIADRFLETGRYGGAPVSQGAALMHFRASEVERTEIVLARVREGIRVSLPSDDDSQPEQPPADVYALFFVVSPEDKPGQHLRVLAELACRVEDEESFVHAWRRIRSPARLKEALLRDARFLELFVGSDEATERLVGRYISDLDLPPGAFVAMVRRGEESFEPRGRTQLARDDHLTFIGDPAAIERLYERYVEPESEG